MDRKKMIIISVAIIVISIVLIIVIAPFTSNKVTCTKTVNNDGFEIRDTIGFVFKENKIDKVEVKKEIEIKDAKVKVKTFLKALENTLENAYAYASANAFEIETNEENKTISLVMNSKKYGVILDNIQINKVVEIDNYTLNAVNNIETAENAFKIGDKYTKSELKNKAKEVGYKCN